MNKNLMFLFLLFAITNCTEITLFDNYFYLNSELTLGDICNLSNNRKGVCKALISCESAKESFYNGNIWDIEFCGFSGMQRLVCCPRSTKFSRALCEEEPQSQSELIFKIVNGNEASPGEFPFQAALGRRNFDDQIEFNCGGSIIADDIILSAAHCFNRVDRSATMARLGRLSLDINDIEDDGEVVDKEIEKVVIHPQYASRTRYNDIALVKLESPLVFTDRIKAICLSSNDIDVPKQFTITGFGSTSPEKMSRSTRLLKGIVNDYSQEQCKDQYKESNVNLIDGQYCANSDSGVDACQGDSGGPLSYEDKNGAWHLYGVISHGASCGSTFPAVYTKVNEYLEWIGDEMLKLED